MVAVTLLVQFLSRPVRRWKSRVLSPDPDATCSRASRLRAVVRPLVRLFEFGQDLAQQGGRGLDGRRPMPGPFPTTALRSADQSEVAIAVFKPREAGGFGLVRERDRDRLEGCASESARPQVRRRSRDRASEIVRSRRDSAHGKATQALSAISEGLCLWSSVMMRCRDGVTCSYGRCV